MKTFISALISLFLGSLIVWLVYTYVIVSVYSLPELNYWQALGITLACKHLTMH